MILRRGNNFLMCVFFAIIFCCLVLSTPSVTALGVSPSRVTMNFEPNYEFETDVCFSAKSIQRLKIEVVGELKEYITLTGVGENGEIDASVKNCVHYKLKLPPKFERPGKHTSGITALEVTDETYGNIFVVVKVTHQIWVFVPYPGKYLEINSFTANNVEAGEVVPFTVEVQSKGEQTIDEAKGRIVVYDRDNNVIGRIDTNTAKEIVLDQPRYLITEWDSGEYEKGNYHAFVEVSYDGGMKINATTEFKLGGLEVNLLNYTREVIIGGIKPFYFLVDSIWSEPIKNVRATANVHNYSSRQEPLTTIETLTKEVPPWSTDMLKGYLDTTNLNPGIYDLKITLFYENMSKEYDGKFSIVKEPPKPEEKKPGLFQRFAAASFMIKALVVVLILLLLAAIGFLIYILIPKRKKSFEKKK